jgi:hypothetical protein
MPDDELSPYDKGVEAGKVLSRLDEHDAHFKRINGSIEQGVEKDAQVAKALQELVLAVQHLEDEFAHRDALDVGATRRWSVWRMGFAVLLTLVVLAVLWQLFRALP